MKKSHRQVRHIMVAWSDEADAAVTEALAAARDIVVTMGGEWKETDGTSSGSDGKRYSPLVDSVLSSMYAAHGETEQMIVKTSAEVAYEVEDMCDAPVRDVAAWLSDNGFETVVADGTVSWLLFEKNVSY